MICESRVERDEHVTNRMTVEAAAEAGTAFWFNNHLHSFISLLNNKSVLVGGHSTHTLQPSLKHKYAAQLS